MLSLLIHVHTVYDREHFHDEDHMPTDVVLLGPNGALHDLYAYLHGTKK